MTPTQPAALSIAATTRSSSRPRALGHLAPQRLSEAFEATMAAWSRSSPPKPADFAAHAPRSTVAIGDTAQDGLTWFDPAEKARKCTRAGYERAREIARRLVDDALRCAPEPLSPDEACRAAMHLRAEAWVAAQHEVITGRGEVLEITRADIARLRGEVAA